MSGLRSVSLLLDEYIHSLTTQQSPAVPIKAEDLHVLVSTSLHCMTPLRTKLIFFVEECNSVTVTVTVMKMMMTNQSISLIQQQTATSKTTT